jgi:hypothetical protein
MNFLKIKDAYYSGENKTISDQNAFHQLYTRNTESTYFLMSEDLKREKIMHWK